MIQRSSDIIIEGNNISNNDVGIVISTNSNNNLLKNNNISNNNDGLYLFGSNNIIYHNNFIDNDLNAHDAYSNSWDNGYPSGGNYWSDYTGADNNHGPDQDKSGSDLIGDIPYNILGGNNQDRYPLMFPYVDQGAPNPPLIEGNTNGKIGEVYSYTFTSIDPNDDDVYYYIDWGDNTNNGWVGPYSSGDEVIKAHKWSSQGTYIIKAKAKDNSGEESEWDELTVSIPRDKSINNPFPELLQIYRNIFPLIQKLIQQHWFGF